MIDKFQQKLVDELNKNEEYKKAPIYTVLMSLVQGSDISEIFMILHNVASDLDKREDLECLYVDSKNWKWAFKKDKINT